MFMMVVTLLGILLAVILCYVDEKDEGKLNAVPIMKDEEFSSTGLSSNDELSQLGLSSNTGQSLI
jgi:hypothetical protein